jgi:hypothetical protein
MQLLNEFMGDLNKVESIMDSTLSGIMDQRTNHTNRVGAVCGA